MRPVILEYKRTTNENVINQGLYYLDWLMDHRAEFQLLVQARIGPEDASRIEWDAPRLLCIAGDFTRYDEYAVQQIPRSVELIRYRRYGDELLLFELINTSADNVGKSRIERPPSPSSLYGGQKPDQTGTRTGATSTDSNGDPSTRHLQGASTHLRNLYEDLRSYLLGLGDDVQEKELKHYVAFRRIRNVACVEIHPQAQILSVFVRVNPSTVHIEPGFTRDVTHVGHLGTGNLEITIRNHDALEKAKSLLRMSYEVG